MTIQHPNAVETADYTYALHVINMVMDYAIVAWRMMMTMMTQDYPEAKLKCFLNPATQFVNNGRLIGEFLYVGRTHNTSEVIGIFNCYGYRFSSIAFKTWNDATKFAELMDEKYKNYFALWYDYPHADVPLLTQYTILTGQALYQTIQHFSGQVITYDEFINVYTRLGA